MLIEAKLKNFRDDDGQVRNDQWLKAAQNGEFSFGPSTPRYASSGPGSWKHEAVGIDEAEIELREQFNYTPEFLKTNWKLFHDAAQTHRLAVLREILPSFGICVI